MGDVLNVAGVIVGVAAAVACVAMAVLRFRDEHPVGATMWLVASPVSFAVGYFVGAFVVGLAIVLALIFLAIYAINQ